jgi:hypothetical protein
MINDIFFILDNFYMFYVDTFIIIPHSPFLIHLILSTIGCNVLKSTKSTCLP